jgi:Acyltransferase
VKDRVIYGLLLGIKSLSAMFYRYNIRWIGQMPRDPWADLRVVLLLNHTSLYEPLFAGFVPNRFLKNISRNGLVPVADKTLDRPLVGHFYRLVARNVIPLSRLRDHTWDRFLAKIKCDSLILMAPEGRMKRPNGFDLEGRPMTVRGGIADLLRTIPGGRMLIAFSGGLHHVQVPNQPVPKLFKTLGMGIESVDIKRYKEAIENRWGVDGFKTGVILDLQSRRDRHCRT